VPITKIEVKLSPDCFDCWWRTDRWLTANRSDCVWPELVFQTRPHSLTWLTSTDVRESLQEMVDRMGLLRGTFESGLDILMITCGEIWHLLTEYQRLFQTEYHHRPYRTRGHPMTKQWQIGHDIGYVLSILEANRLVCLIRKKTKLISWSFLL
jgi:hypothetical protein